MSGSPKKKAPMCIQADLQKHVKKTGKKAAAKKAQTKDKPKEPQKPHPNLVPIYLQIHNQPYQFFLDPKLPLHQLTHPLLTQHPSLLHLQPKLQKLLLKQIVLQLTKPKQKPSHIVFQDQPRVHDLEINDIALLRKIFDMICCTSDGYLHYEQRDCRKLVEVMPAYHLGVLQEVMVMMFHRREVLGFQDFVYLVCEEGKLQLFRGLFEE